MMMKNIANVTATTSSSAALAESSISMSSRSSDCQYEPSNTIVMDPTTPTARRTHQARRRVLGAATWSENC